MTLSQRHPFLCEFLHQFGWPGSQFPAHRQRLSSCGLVRTTSPFVLYCITHARFPGLMSSSNVSIAHDGDLRPLAPLLYPLSWLGPGLRPLVVGSIARFVPLCFSPC